MNTAYVLLRSGYADWEPASALAELRRTFGFSVRTIGLTTETVVSMGGLRVIPDLTLPEFEPESADILILPGGDSWTNGEVPEVSKAAQTMVALGRPVAAICAATLALAYAACSMSICIPAMARTLSANTFPSIAAESYIKHLHQSAIDSLSQQMV